MLRWLILVSFFILNSCTPLGHSTVTIVNKSPYVISQGSISILDIKQDFSNIEIGKKRKFEFDVDGDRNYNLQITFSNGDITKEDIGYLSAGFDTVDLLIVKENEIEMKRISSQTSN